MSIADRLQDAHLLYANGRRDGALLSVLVAVAATARRRYGRGYADRRAFTTFLGEEMIVVTGGGVKNYNVHVPGADMTRYVGEAMPLQDCFYEFVRCNLAHEATLPDNVSFESAEPGRLTVRITDDAICLSDTFMDGLARAAEYAPENADLFPEFAEMPDDVVAWMLFKNRRGNEHAAEYMARRRRRIEKLTALDGEH